MFVTERLSSAADEPAIAPGQNEPAAPAAAVAPAGGEEPAANGEAVIPQEQDGSPKGEVVAPSGEEPAAVAPAAEGESAVRGEAVIPAGQEELLAAMIGKGATLPDQCKLTAAGIDHTFIKATYTCPGGEVVFDLAHPSKAPAQATRTERFALTLRSGSPPAGLAPALESLVRSREAGFQWTYLKPPPPSDPTPTAKRFSPARIVLAVAGLLGIAALGSLLRRRKPAPPTQLP